MSFCMHTDNTRCVNCWAAGYQYPPLSLYCASCGLHKGSCYCHGRKLQQKWMEMAQQQQQAPIKSVQALADYARWVKLGKAVEAMKEGDSLLRESQNLWVLHETNKEDCCPDYCKQCLHQGKTAQQALDRS